MRRSFSSHRNGRRDPSAELDATLTAFFDPAHGGYRHATHPQCRFPARYAWLKEQLNFHDGPAGTGTCPRFDHWRSQMDPESVTLVKRSPPLLT